MASTNNIIKFDPAVDSEFADVVSKIQPLPQQIVPSERFVEQTRLMLLGLQPKRTTQAA
jgi:hypothetical protein